MTATAIATSKHLFLSFQVHKKWHFASQILSIFAASIVVGGIVFISIAARLIKCYVKVRLRDTNPSLHSPSTANTPCTPSSSIMNTRSVTVKRDSDIIDATMERFLENILNEKPMRFTPQQLSNFTCNYAEKLGAGGFGVAYKGWFPNGVRVAVKVLKKTQDRTAEEQFMAEVATIGRTYHKHLVRLYGFCFDPAVKALVYEFMASGSLDRHLFNENLSIEWAKLYEIAVGTAKGIRYLHEECEQRIIHYDIKPGNVLLDESFSPKVADFGLAKLCNRDASHVTNTGARGTPGYAAPEMWMPLPLTYKCDVYSFGMLLFEILGRRRNLDFRNNESKEWFPKWVWERYEKGQLNTLTSVYGIKERDEEKAERMCKVALWCVQYKPDIRPSMGKVVRMLEGEEEIMKSPNPFEHMAMFDADLSSSGYTSTSASKSTSS